MPTHHFLFRQGISDLREVLRVSKAILAKFREGRIIVGADCRGSSQTIVNLLTSVLTEAGLDVTQAGLTPTPALRLAIRNFAYSGGIMVTGSSEPPEINGVKLFDSQGFPLKWNSLPPARRSPKRWEEVGAVDLQKEVTKNYVAKLLKASQDPFKKGVKIVIDPGNGLQTLAAPTVLEDLGATVVTLNGNLDGTFPSRGPRLSTNSLRELSDSVRALKADLGIAFDADGDQAAFLDRKGAVQREDIVATNILKFTLSSRHHRNVVTPKATSVIKGVADEFQAKLRLLKPDSETLSEAIVHYGAIFGYDGRGRYVYTPFAPIEDPVIASILLIHSISSGRTVSGL